MGIKYLNNFFQTHCTSGIYGDKYSSSYPALQTIHFQNLANRVIAVDTSIFMYKFAGENALLENMYLMISLFRKYRITPLFVFDGKPPVEKKDILEERKQAKRVAEEKYLTLQKELETAVEEKQIAELEMELHSLKKQFIRLKDADVNQVKSLIKSYGVQYIDAAGEADRLCVQLVNEKKAWACMSDDMDMFVYGCQRVLRYVSLIRCNAVLYNLNTILKELDMSLLDLKQVCVLSGTDYFQEKELNLYNVILMYNDYRLWKLYSPHRFYVNFYGWLFNDIKRGLCDDDELIAQYTKIMMAFDMFVVGDKSGVTVEKMCEPEWGDIIDLLKKEHFFYVEESQKNEKLNTFDGEK